MTRRRIFLAVTVLVAAFLIGPEAARTIFNTADILVILSPFALIAALSPLIPRKEEH